MRPRARIEVRRGLEASQPSEAERRALQARADEKRLALERRVRALETEKHRELRRADCDEWEATGRISVDERGAIERAYDASPEATRALISTRPAQTSVARTMTVAESREYAQDAGARFAIDPAEIV